VGVIRPLTGHSGTYLIGVTVSLHAVIDGYRRAAKACRKQDLGTVIEILVKHGVTQGWIAGRTGIGQGRLSQYSASSSEGASPCLIECRGKARHGR
jgi:hypothetical protein